MDGRWTCTDCGSLWTPGAPCCPACRSLSHADEVPAPATPPLPDKGA